VDPRAGIDVIARRKILCESSGSHSSEYEDGSVLEYIAM
jgi:hypothetical protein